MVKRGECIIGRKTTSKHLGMSEQEMRTALQHLKSTSEITIKSTNKFSVITICKWEEYQLENKNQPTKQPAHQQTSNQQATTPKEYKNIRSIEYIVHDEKLIKERGLDLLQEFLDYRSETDSKGNQLWTKQKTWDTNLRLKKWKKNRDTNFGRKQILDYEIVENFHKGAMKDEWDTIKDFFRNKYKGDIWKDHYWKAKTKRKESPLFLETLR